jgi:hypothetical protein
MITESDHHQRLVGQERERRAGASGPDQRRGDPTAPLVLIDLETEEGPIGRSYVFSYTPLALEPLRRLAEDLGTALRGDAVAPLEIERKLQGMFRLLGPQGLTGIAAASTWPPGTPWHGRTGCPGRAFGTSAQQPHLPRGERPPSGREPDRPPPGIPEHGGSHPQGPH